jgi:hypothetical protein
LLFAANPVGTYIFFNIISYFFNIVKPVGPRFSGNYRAYEGPLEVAKKSHMGVPIGNTGLVAPARPVNYQKIPLP